jgi:hypothetical protein
MWPNNIVWDIKPNDIIAAERLLGFQFPAELRQFYQEVGCARITSPEKRPVSYKFYDSNEILPPLVAAHFYQGIKKYHEAQFEDPLEYDEHYLANYILDLLEPGDLPFFEIGDSSSFMVMKTQSDNPNAVWYMGEEKIEDSLEKFIWKLYYEGPSYYTKNW